MTQYTTKALEVGLLLLVGLVTTTPAHGDCPLALRSYEDVEGRGFVLEFDPPSPPTDASPQQLAVVRILHATRGEIFALDVHVQVGYGRVLLTGPDSAYTAYFFTEDLRSTRTEESSRLLFIDGLGLADWSDGEDPGRIETPLGDVIWRLSACKE